MTDDLDRPMTEADGIREALTNLRKRMAAPMWTAREAAEMLAGVVPYDEDYDDDDDGSREYRFMPDCWLEKGTRTEIIEDSISTCLKRTSEAVTRGVLRTQSPEEWIEWSISRDIAPKWLDAWRDMAIDDSQEPPLSEYPTSREVADAFGQRMGSDGRDRLYLKLGDAMKYSKLLACRVSEKGVTPARFDPAKVARWLVNENGMPETTACSVVGSHFPQFRARFELGSPQYHRNNGPSPFPGIEVSPQILRTPPQ